MPRRKQKEHSEEKIPARGSRREASAHPARKGSAEPRARPAAPSRKPAEGLLIDGEGYAFSFTPFADGDRGEAGGIIGWLQFIGTTGDALGNGARLTPRETQVAWLLARRATNAEIAAALGRSAHTARNHTRRILEKLGLNSKADVRVRLTTNKGKGKKEGI